MLFRIVNYSTLETRTFGNTSNPINRYRSLPDSYGKPFRMHNTSLAGAKDRYGRHGSTDAETTA